MTTTADRIMQALATRLGEHTGRCPICHRLWRLTRSGGLLPPHHAGSGAQCPGSEREPAQDGERVDT